MSLPYYRFYPADWLGDARIQAMTLEEEGAYHRLCAQMWQLGQDCTLPDDDALLARLLRVTPEKWAELRAVLVDGPMAVFQKTADGRLTNKRLREEWDKAISKQRQAREAAASRWQSASDADAYADALPDAPAGGHAGAMPYPEAHMPRNSDAHNPQPTGLQAQDTRAHAREPASRPADRAWIQAYRDLFGDSAPLHGGIIGVFQPYADRLGSELVVEALKRGRHKAAPTQWAERALMAWEQHGIRSLADLERHEERRRAAPARASPDDEEHLTVDELQRRRRERGEYVDGPDAESVRDLVRAIGRIPP